MLLSVLEAVNKNLKASALKSIEKKERDYSHFHPSEWDGCKRKIAYSYYESKQYITIDNSCLKIDPQAERIFGNGHFTHDRWKLYLEKIGCLLGCWKCKNWMAHDKPKIYGKESKIGILKPDKCDCGSDRFEYIEVSVYDEETMWGGHVDAIVDTKLLKQYMDRPIDPNDDNYIIVDFKTINDFSYTKNLDFPKPNHITQIQIYMYLTGIKTSKFIYENKNTQAVKEFLVGFDENIIAIKRAEAIALKKQVTLTNTKGEHTLPHRGYDSKASYECMKCKYRGHCWDSKPSESKPKVDAEIPKLAFGELDV